MNEKFKTINIELGRLHKEYSILYANPFGCTSFSDAISTIVIDWPKRIKIWNRIKKLENILLEKDK